MAAHVHAALMLQYAQDAQHSEEPWKQWEMQSSRNPGWEDCISTPRWQVDCKYRRKPSVITIGTMEVPEPMRRAPELGDRYWTADPTISEYAGSCLWAGNTADRLWFERRLVHDNEESAILHSKALILASGGSCTVTD